MRDSIPALASASLPAHLVLLPSPLRPPCRADRRIFEWHGVNTPPPTVISHPVLELLAARAADHSLRDTGSYGSGLRKYHIFCDVFSVSEDERLPASFPLLHSFALWAAADPVACGVNEMTGSTHFEPVAPVTVHKYLAAVRAWHIVQGWPSPLSPDDHDRINFSLRGLEELQGSRRKPPRPPVTIHMLATLRSELDLTDPFDACVWAMASCAFWGLMRFGEVSVKSLRDFDPSRHLTRANAHFGHDTDGKPYFRLDLPSAKTAKHGEVQHVFITKQGTLCGIDSLFNLGRVVPAQTAQDPLFSWRDRLGSVRPMVKAKALARINGIFARHGWGTAFGHSFRIGGASFLLGQGVDPEVVRLAGRWKSLAYETYIRAFEQVASRHTANLSQRYGH
ncbi:hypothetical protein PHLGIDRAFT_78049 [Phlebiopsis gigantea 11061_1 CR5-6]|uniref:Tyr recombinase domain-containing protein n=1 Tax=Phlebiopsis gigantea (strain 11061_1 CR5-6) TaxID=745531 RepID=A0A0C3S4R6_PHLG1|nr:hypothetical protein PHLGIDRAFT_78049 [Phlebiopsis gigantea 11061_1 CR5-6]